MELRKKVERALKAAFDTDVVELVNDDGISGFVVSAMFDEREMFDRQSMIESALTVPTAKLTPDERRSVLFIAALAPAEHAFKQSLENVGRRRSANGQHRRRTP